MNASYVRSLKPIIKISSVTDPVVFEAARGLETRRKSVKALCLSKKLKENITLSG